MSRISLIPTTRVSSLLITQRLSQQVQADQLDLFKIQSQVASGHRLVLPSDDPAAALRGITLQRLLERQGQLQKNLNGVNAYLAAADASLSSVSQIITDLRGTAIGVADTFASDDQRQAFVDQVNRALEQIVNTGNVKFQGRYLFSGSRSLPQPYDYKDQFVEYLGNEVSLRSHVDFSFLYESNLPGPDVFGGISAAVKGTADLQPHLTANTLVSSLNGGRGLSPNGSIAITVATGSAAQSAVIDLSDAATIGDVARRIESGAPPGTSIAVEVVGNALRISSDSASVTNITISEVSDGITARELGIATESNSVQSVVNGMDLDPAVLNTTQLGDVLGSKSQVRLVSAGSNNNLRLTAAENGAALNGMTVQFVAGGTAGSEAVSLVGSTLTVELEEGISTAQQVAAAITAEGTFIATIDLNDAISVLDAGRGAAEVTTFANTTFGGSGTSLDLTSGIRVSNGNDTVTLDISQAETVEDLLNLFNGSGLSLQAEINANRNGINVRSRLNGADFTIGENGGVTATQLGIRTLTGDSKLTDFNRGVGVLSGDGDDLLITARDGTTFGVDLSSAMTVQDVVDAINGDVENTGLVSAQLATFGNGIEIIDQTGATAVDLQLAASPGSQAAYLLGFLPEGETSVSDSTGTLQSDDRHTLEADSIFNTLVRLRDALEANDIPEIGRTIDRLDEDFDRINFARSEFGARQQSLESLNIRLEDDEVQLRAALSDQLDVDLAEAISNLTARQFALQASLQTSASLLSLSLLDFL